MQSLMTLEEVAEKSRISVRLVKQMTSPNMPFTRRLKSVKLGRKRLVRPVDYAEWIENMAR